ncbi:MAG TPA: LysM peptidoglycan-binding domain-containing protein [Saprospiraceae bacterium]|nr:LysM peptidoglycan-binding domain-containing protein [Saprospiraceae bacterium]
MKKDTAMNQSLNENASDSVLVEVISFSRPFNFPPEDIVEKQTQEIPNDYMADASVSDVPTPEIEWTTDYKYHIIRSRESLSDIATLYDKVSVDELMYWNELSPESSLKVGSVLVIKK